MSKDYERAVEEIINDPRTYWSHCFFLPNRVFRILWVSVLIADALFVLLRHQQLAATTIITCGWIAVIVGTIVVRRNSIVLHYTAKSPAFPEPIGYV